MKEPNTWSNFAVIIKPSQFDGVGHFIEIKRTGEASQSLECMNRTIRTPFLRNGYLIPLFPTARDPPWFAGNFTLPTLGYSFDA